MYRVAKISVGVYFTQYFFFKVDGEYIEFNNGELAKEFAEINGAKVVKWR